MLDIFLRPAFLGPIALLTSYIVYTICQAIYPSNLPKLPIVGTKSGSWLPPILQARWQNSTNYKSVADEINTKYKHQPCLVPIGGSETVVLLPASETQHIVDQPDAVLNMPQPMIQGLQFKYTVHDQIIVDEPIHQKIVSSNLTRQITNLVDDVVDETEWAFDKYWGTDTSEFNELVVFETVRRIIGSVTNRAFVGLPACRNPGLVDAGMSYARALPEEARNLRMFPGFVKPFIAPWYTKKTKQHTKEFYDILMPEIKRRLEEHDTTKEEQKNDFLQWSIDQAKSPQYVSDKRMAAPSTLAGRILMVNFGAIHTTSFTVTHAIFDLFSSDQSNVDELREEISTALSSHGGGDPNGSDRWTKKALTQMPKLDSLIRESLRLNLVSTFGVPRLVVAKTGFTTLSGVHIPRGNIVAVAGKNIAKDEAIYPDAETYKPFRFAQTDGVKTGVAAAATTSPEYLPFGHGKHACPGRFFAASEMKLILGWMIMNYDVEHLDKRPDDIYAGPARLPPMTAKIRVRRRVV
ncbi:cytochrome P450 [Apodospora peruviana]|uniref:Cytochrome P450 n=1 Tax=Apodospora peruviana TaxID=516989 RepID=A0AAE0I0F3_9PEZI|nr:cytochrome P450 [Apodospora peruviana]